MDQHNLGEPTVQEMDIGKETKIELNPMNTLVIVNSPSTQTTPPSKEPENTLRCGSCITAKGEESLWLMEFDGSCAVSSSGAGVVLIAPSGTHIPFSFKLEFKNTNNVIEYEALLLGLAEAKKLGVKLLRVKGDAELIVKHVRGLFNVKKERLEHYQNRVCDEIEDFHAFSI
ncbi:uncharacterized protein LOC131029055 [Cryptomeria japonica]|uniref:uncharacterized protein LOC131029055 n=1 Tax=Cryptomeria japonica TaxID=3369 RepID=UPI0025ACE002|nr:uncharacterized protein LOC131029055 [Cryptomeria japonica]